VMLHSGVQGHAKHSASLHLLYALFTPRHKHWALWLILL
jgi:hypothetical protein